MGFGGAREGYAEVQRQQRRFSVLALTDNATDAIERILAAPGIPTGAGIRITPGAGNDGGAPASELQLSVAEEPAATDEVIEEQGARVFVEDTVSGYLDDKQLDAEVIDERVSFSLQAG
jgi:iron-sulfur cluster assembly protein